MKLSIMQFSPSALSFPFSLVQTFFSGFLHPVLNTLNVFPLKQEAKTETKKQIKL
jgi:hypothetical protein